MNYEARHAGYVAACEEALQKAINRYFMPGSKVAEAAEYALLGGGKRVRGVLALAVCDMLKGNMMAAASYAAAMEMVHAFSLVHDDLPCMDDDDMRRGRAATHIAYGESTALLAGDMLAIQAFEVAAGAGGAKDSEAVALLARAAGSRGMIYGQELDLQHENTPCDEAILREIHRYKTGALILAAAQLGVLAAGTLPGDAPAVAGYAENLGLCFQVVDDILDVTATQEVLGKPIGSDSVQGKTTFASLLGVEKAQEQARALTANAVGALRESYGDEAEFLCEYAERLALRVY